MNLEDEAKEKMRPLVNRLLGELKIPRTPDQVTYDIEVSKGTIHDYSFSASFPENEVVLRVRTMNTLYPLYFEIGGVFLESIVAHELMHYHEEKLTPNEWIMILPVGDVKAVAFKELVINQLRDAVVFSLMEGDPRLETFKTFKVIERFAMKNLGKWGKEGIRSYVNKIRTPPHVIDVEFDWHFIPLVDLFFVLNQARGTGIDEILLPAIERETSGPGMPHYNDLKNLIDTMISMSMREKTFSKDLSKESVALMMLSNNAGSISFTFGINASVESEYG